MTNKYITIEATKFFEIKFKEKGIPGKSLHDQLSSIENKLSKKTLRSLKEIIAIRNKVAHEDTKGEIDLVDFMRTSLECSFEIGKAFNIEENSNHPSINSTYSCIREEKSHIGEFHTLKKVTHFENELSLAKTEAPPTPPTKTLLGLIPVINPTEREQLIDDTITKAHAEYFPAYEDWDGCIFMAKNEGASISERLQHLANAVALGADSKQMEDLATSMSLWS